MAARALPLTLLAATLVAACGSASDASQHASTSAATPPPARGDAFKGTITAATGRLAGDRGHVAIVLAHAPVGSNASTSLTLSIRGTSCAGHPSCLRLTGSLRGRMTLVHSLPDVGHRFEITARGTVKPLGHVTASGTAAGTGFIRSGHTGLNLTLRNATGTVTIEVQSGPVPGRTDP